MNLRLQASRAWDLFLVRWSLKILDVWADIEQETKREIGELQKVGLKQKKRRKKATGSERMPLAAVTGKRRVQQCPEGLTQLHRASKLGTADWWELRWWTREFRACGDAGVWNCQTAGTRSRGELMAVRGCQWQW